MLVRSSICLNDSNVAVLRMLFATPNALCFVRQSLDKTLSEPLQALHDNPSIAFKWLSGKFSARETIFLGVLVGMWKQQQLQHCITFTVFSFFAVAEMSIFWILTKQITWFCLLSLDITGKSFRFLIFLGLCDMLAFFT